MKIALKILGYTTLLLVVLYGICILHRTPSNDRTWVTEQAVLPEITKNGTLLTVKNVRNFRYESATSSIPGYYDASYDTDDLVSLDFIVVPFEGPGAAHTMLSFGFRDGRHLVVSVETRKEVGEMYSPLRGLFRGFELMYVIADERDVISLRTHVYGDPVYVYPVTTTEEKMASLFVDMLTRAEDLRQNPEFYNTFTNNCTIVIADHVNALTPGRVPFDFSYIFPRDADVYAQKLGLIAEGMTIEEARERYRVNERANAHLYDDDFSRLIREE